MKQPLIRRYHRTDARAISDLFRSTYDGLYAVPDAYLPQAIEQSNVDGRWHSCVAMDGEQLVGHAALVGNPDSRTAELAMCVVAPNARGKSIATRLGRHLLVQAQNNGVRCVTIKQVTYHPYTQRMASKLGFHNTGLLADHAPSPVDQHGMETMVLGCCVLNGHRQPLPSITWPSPCRGLIEPLCELFGTHEGEHPWNGPPLVIERHGNRYDMVLEGLNDDLLGQLQRLPVHWLISLRLKLASDFAADHDALSGIGFVFSGLAPGGGNDGWMVLFHRGMRAQTLTLHCPSMQQLHDQVQSSLLA